jgi:hypothetical protein
MKRSIALMCGLAGLLTFPSPAAKMPLEWNPTYPVDVPWEVELSPSKLAALAGAKGDSGFAVTAQTAAGEKKLHVTALEGRLPGTVALRFNVPPGTTALSCETTAGRLKLRDAATTDNIFAGALAASALSGWKLTNGGKAATLSPQPSMPNGGVTFTATRSGNVNVSYAADVPERLAGQPVFIEIDIENIAKLTSGSLICIDQLDAAGKTLPEALSDPRWLSHMRPAGKFQRLREEGRLHPKARKLSFTIAMRTVSGNVDEYGLPVKSESDLWPALKVTKLAVRPAARLPFPKYDDSFFVPGPSGKPGDTALSLVGDRAFWYATHSHACWSQGKQTDDIDNVFYPDRAGTVEAWLKPAWPAGVKRTFNIFTASHRYNSNESRNIKPKYDAMTLKYTPAKETFDFVILDWDGKAFKKSVKAPFASGEWHHVAVQWDPAKTADMYLDGKRVFSLPLTGFEAWDLKARTEVVPNGRIPLELHIGSNYTLGRISAGEKKDTPFFPGAIDGLRVSSVCRYASEFRPADSFRVDADTRALFTFDRTFDGVSGGGYGFISGTLFAKDDRVDHRLALDGKEAWYYAREIVPENNPKKVLSNLNYQTLPDADGFRFARRVVKKSFTLSDGETATLDCPARTTPEYVEIANCGASPLVYPALVNKGEFDPRSFGDLADSLLNGREGLSDRERANAVFQFVLGASDYFMQHTITFPAGSDQPESVVYKALMMLNGYCGFECGPLNNMAANMLACVARCPASQTGGYGHSFEQVHFDGKNHTYDLSAQKFFPAMDNETSSCLGESEVQPYLYNRLGGDCGSFIRIFTRGYSAQNPSYQEKVSMILNPGESFRVWQANDGHVNDLHIHWWAKGEDPARSSYREDYTAQTHAKLSNPQKQFLTRMDRFFPHYLSGFVAFDGKPAAANPAFGDVKPDSFCYRVKSCYPIVHGEYSAETKDGRAAAIELSTDGGKTFRAVPEVLDYEVRARVAYLVRVKAPIDSVKRFRASTEVMVNPRVFTGRVHAGRNELLFKSTDPAAVKLPSDGAAPAKVTVAWREDVKRAEIAGGVFTGVIPGLEKQVVFLDPAKPQALALSGFSPAAKVDSFVLNGAAGGGAKRGPEARIAGGELHLAAAKGEPEPSIACVRITDGGAMRDLYVVTSSAMRYAPLADAKLLGGAQTVAAGDGQIQASAMCKARGDGAKFAFAPVRAGEYTVYMVDRFPSEITGAGDLNRPVFAADWPGRANGESVATGSAGNQGVNLYKARYGKLDGRANFKWDYVLSDVGYHPYFPRYKPRTLKFTEGADSFSFTLKDNYERGAELCAALVVPVELEREFTCELTKLLCGMNTDPARLATR